MPLPTRAPAKDPRTILLVEDEPFVREATHSILASAGFRVLAADAANTAQALFEQSPSSIDLVITDMVLPGRTGEQLGRDLRRHSPELMVLITSGYPDADMDIEKPASHTYFLAKPYSRRGLIEKIEMIFACTSPALPAAQAG